MLRMLEAQAPAKQTATETINTLSGRLSNASLLEDRRAAIRGLRSFADNFPASVASESLRDLIACLSRDTEDVDTIKLVLETLLMLFNPSRDSPEASEEIVLWMADEFTQRQDNIKVLLDLIESVDFYSRLYSLKLISAIFTARPSRTQECVLNATLGASRLVSSLDDERDGVRNAGIMLLSDLTQSSLELQKLVAFEGTFDRLFHLIQQRGGLGRGGMAVQQCLDLLASLVRENSSNQSLFRESGCVPRIADLLKNCIASAGLDADDDIWKPQRDKNIWGLLAFIRLFLVSGNLGTQTNQKIFHKHGLLQQVLNLAFTAASDSRIKIEALHTCADMIRGSAELQVAFAQMQVPAHEKIIISVDGNVNGDIPKVFVIDSVLELIIVAPSSPTFEVRLAACECIKAYFYKHDQIRRYFLNQAIQGHISHEGASVNVISTLLDEGQQKSNDPYRTWFAAVILFHIIWEDQEAKSLLMNISEGNAENGEEVVTCIQMMVGNLISGIQNDEDERIVIGYFMLLCGWLFEDPAAVNDLLSEGSSIQVLIQTIMRAASHGDVIAGFCAVLLSIVYDFSTKDSPISRRKLHPILTSTLGRDRFLLALAHLRQHPLVRDFEVFSPGTGDPESEELPPYAYFDATFIEFLKDNFSRIRRSIDRDPGIEVHLQSGEQGFDRDLVDELRSQIEDKDKDLEAAESRILELQQKVDQEQANGRKAHDVAQTELDRIKQMNGILQKKYEADATRMQAEHETLMNQLQYRTSNEIQSLREEINNTIKMNSEEAKRTKDYYESSLSQARTSKINLDMKLAKVETELDVNSKERSRMEAELKAMKIEVETRQTELHQLQNAASQKERELEELRASLTQYKEVAEDEKLRVTLLEKEVTQLTLSNAELEGIAKSGETKAKELEEAKNSAQSELDDLLMVLGDIEEKRARDKKRLKELGEEVSEDEGEGEDDEDEEQDEEDD